MTENENVDEIADAALQLVLNGLHVKSLLQ